MTDPHHVDRGRSTPHLPHQSALPSYASAEDYLKTSFETSRLATSKPDGPAPTLITTIWTSFPWLTLLAQAIWSGAVITAAYFLANDDPDKTSNTLSSAFWQTDLNIPSSLLSGVGWALFVLLGFYIREASRRYMTAVRAWNVLVAHLIITLRHFIQIHSTSFWHQGDLDRIVAHLAACPIAVKMALRGERNRAQLEPILHPSDLDDVMAADSMHAHCLRVVRSYLTAREPDAAYGFQPPDRGVFGPGIAYITLDFIDTVIYNANTLINIAHFSPAAGYVTHLFVFMIIWLFFLPLNLVAVSGWFTILFACLITYGVSMLFYIAAALDDPFGFDPHDLKLNQLAAKGALEILTIYTTHDISLKTLIRPDHETPKWLENPEGTNHADLDRYQFQGVTSSLHRFINGIVSAFFRIPTPRLLLPMSLFTLWSVFVVVGTYFLSGDSDFEEGCRWWCPYIPINTSITAYISLAVFLILAFWLNDTYSRYWTALQVWQTEITPSIEEAASQLALYCKPGLVHPRDRERLFSFFAALPFVSKQFLRKSKDLSELEDVLCPTDLEAVAAAPNAVRYCIHVLCAYWSSMEASDPETNQSKSSPFGSLVYNHTYIIWGLERSFTRCKQIRDFQLPASFTLHLQIFTTIWLALLPLSIVQFYGWLSFIVIIPVGYSIITLLLIGTEFSDPFGYDAHDIPMDRFCHSIKDAVHRIYTSYSGDLKKFVHGSDYPPQKFIPKSESLNLSTQIPKTSTPTILTTLVSVFKTVPSVPVVPFLSSVVWTIAAVFISKQLSDLWPKAKREGCRGWCSPSDVDGGTFGNIGFALFLILAFRASDAISRYELGADLLLNLQYTLRSVVVEFCSAVSDGVMHDGEKRRFVAHAVQIPLHLRDLLLGSTSEFGVSESLLSGDDFEAFKSHSDSMGYLLDTIRSYVLMIDVQDRDRSVLVSDNPCPGFVRAVMMSKPFAVRRLISQILACKRYPVVISYTSHQRVFTALWLFLLPWSMTPTTGYYTILWAPIISYGVLALENIAIKLVDPLGSDDIDIPVAEMCNNAANDIVNAALSCKWDTSEYTFCDGEPEPAHSSAVVSSDGLGQKHQLPYCDYSDHTLTSAAEPASLYFKGRDEDKMEPNSFVHLLHSVPWATLSLFTAWGAVACTISYAARTDGESERWWTSQIIVSSDVALYVSFAAFLLLSFFVDAAYSRYKEASEIWLSSLKITLHRISVVWSMQFTPNSHYTGDFKRVFGLLASLPIVLKHQVRDDRNLSELRGLLSKRDMGTILVADNMALRVVEMLKAHAVEYTTYPARLSNPSNVVIGCHTFSVMFSFRELESLIQRIDFLHTVPISSAFIRLSDALVFIWFLFLPFVFAEQSGWFSILWIFLIAYSILGLRHVAVELQQPFGTDLNDIDLDEAADTITRDILCVQRRHSRGIPSYIKKNGMTEAWSSSTNDRNSLSGTGSDTSVLERFKLVAHAISPVSFLCVLFWAAFSSFLAWLTNEYWKFSGVECANVWCARIAVNNDVKAYIGFSLFLLLGFRLYDSHSRYVSALSVWQGELFVEIERIGNIFLTMTEPSNWHKDDLERVAGHLAGAAIVLVSQLRGENYGKKLREVVTEEDAQLIEAETDGSLYCLDVVRGYFHDEDRKSKLQKNKCTIDSVFALTLAFHVIDNVKGKCEKIKKVPLPFGYVQHMNYVLLIWLVLLPLGLVESSGWRAILWTILISYGVLGIVTWCNELADPFGHDLSDVPLDMLLNHCIEIIKENVRLTTAGTASFIFPGRNESFPGIVQDKIFIPMEGPENSHQ